MFKTTISLFSLLTWLNDKPISSIPFPLKFPFHLSLSMMLTFFGNYFLFHIFLLFLYMYPNLFFFFFFFFGSSYMKTKYGSQPWFQENLHSGCISTKDALKFSLIYPLQNLLVSHLSFAPFVLLSNHPLQEI